MVIYNKDTSNPDNIEIMEHAKGPLSSHAVLSEVRAKLLKIAVCNKHYSRAYLELSEVMRVIDAKISEHLR